LLTNCRLDRFELGQGSIRRVRPEKPRAEISQAKAGEHHQGAETESHDDEIHTIIRAGERKRPSPVLSQAIWL